ncbi:hypothetical protein DV738_g2282, partial [Chaetothyriales sp. CBS 135597]
MAEALGIAASIVAVTVPALHVTRLLLTDLQQLKDAPKTVKRLADDVRSVDTALELLKGIDEKDWEYLGAPVAEHARTSISSHTRACALFREDLQQWTKHSSDGKLVWQNRANVGFFKKSQITAMQLDVFQNKLEDLSLSSDDDEEAVAAPGGKAKVLQQLEEGHRATDASRKLIDELLAKLQEENRAKASPGHYTKSIKIIMGARNSGLAIGIVNGGSVTFTGK